MWHYTITFQRTPASDCDTYPVGTIQNVSTYPSLMDDLSLHLRHYERIGYSIQRIDIAQLCQVCNGIGRIPMHDYGTLPCTLCNEGLVEAFCITTTPVPACPHTHVLHVHTMTIRDIPDIHAFVERHRKHMMESFADFIDAKRAWSLATFGPGERVTGVTRHIEKEIEEIRKQPNDVME